MHTHVCIFTYYMQTCTLIQKCASEQTALYSGTREDFITCGITLPGKFIKLNYVTMKIILLILRFTNPESPDIMTILNLRQIFDVLHECSISNTYCCRFKFEIPQQVNESNLHFEQGQAHTYAHSESVPK